MKIEMRSYQAGRTAREIGQLSWQAMQKAKFAKEKCSDRDAAQIALLDIAIRALYEVAIQNAEPADILRDEPANVPND